MVSGGNHPSVIGQPPHRRTQYALAASISCIRASCSDALVMITTLSGNASFITARTIFPREHDFQYGLATTRTPSHALPGDVSSNRHCDGSRNSSGDAPVHIHRESFSTFAAITSPANEQRPPKARPACGAVGPLAFAPPSQRAAPFHAENAGLARASFRCPQIPGRAPFQGAGNLVRLAEGFGVAPPSRLREPVKSPISHLPCREIHGDDLGHSSSSKCAPRLEASQ